MAGSASVPAKRSRVTLVALSGLLIAAIACARTPSIPATPAVARGVLSPAPPTPTLPPSATIAPTDTPLPSATAAPSPTPTATPMPAEATVDLASVVDPVVEQATGEFALVGVIVGVRTDEHPPYLAAFGYADAASGTPARASSVFPVGSVTKQFTAAAILKLADAGYLSLDDSIARFIADAPPSWKPVTLRHLLTHTSGLQDLSPETLAALDPNSEHGVHDVVELIKQRNTVLASVPGSAHQYVSVGYYLLGAVIENVSGISYGEYLRQAVLVPAGLAATGFGMALPSDLTQGHVLADDGLRPVGPVQPSLTYSVGGLVSTAGDLLAWQQALAGGRVVSPEQYREMTTPVALLSGADVPYGYGLRIGHQDCADGVHHGGRLRGYESYTLHCEADDLGIVVLLNSSPVDLAAIEVIVSRLARALLGAGF